MSRLVGRAIGGVVNPVVSNVDFNEVLERIDMNVVIDRVDLDRVLERIDVNLLLERIDFDRLIDRLPIEDIIDRSNIGAIVARSSSGIFSHIIDAIRAQAARCDHILQGMGRCRCYYSKRYGEWKLPPKPGKYDEAADEKLRCPRNASALAYAVQGRNAGIVSRGCAYGIDQIFIFFSFAFYLILVEEAYSVVQGGNFEIEEWTYALLYYSYGVAYDFFSIFLVGRTFGMIIMGLMVINQNGRWLGPIRCLLRAFFLSSTILILPSLVFGLIRKDRRHFHDLLCSSCVIYSWDAQPPRKRKKNETDSEKDRDRFFRPLEDDEDDDQGGSLMCTP